MIFNKIKNKIIILNYILNSIICIITAINPVVHNPDTFSRYVPPNTFRGNVSRACGYGYFKIKFDNLYTCKPCWFGFYQPNYDCVHTHWVDGNSNCCLPCPPGKIGTMDGLLMKKNRGRALKECPSCPVGKWKAWPSWSMCRACPYWKRPDEPTEPNINQTACVCKRGMFGTVNMARNGGHTCRSCPSGAYCIDGEINYCSPGKYQSQSSKTFCSL